MKRIESFTYFLVGVLLFVASSAFVLSLAATLGLPNPDLYRYCLLSLFTVGTLVVVLQVLCIAWRSY